MVIFKLSGILNVFDFRLQLQGESAVGGPGNQMYRGMVKTAVGVIKEEVSNIVLEVQVTRCTEAWSRQQ